MKIAVKEKRFPSATGNCNCRYRMWIPEEVRAAVQLTHGMAEHIDRYDAFARFLAENGVLVYGQDHAGHGKSIGEGMPKGFFADENGWDALVQDMRTLRDTVKKDYPSIPFLLFGHSMGSFLARTYAGRDGKDFDAYIFCGTAGKNPVLPAARFLARREIRKHGGRTPSALLHRLAFGPYNRFFRPNRTEVDWLSKDEDNVDRYIADDLCGFVFTASAMLDLFNGLGEISGRQWAASVPDRPILMIAGDRDPVGNMGRGVTQVANWLKETGHTVELILYPGGRHEILNESNREEIYRDVLLFIETVAAAGELV